MSKKISRNDSCPCWSGLKYKRCCLNKINWEKIHSEKQDPLPYLSARGKNLLFIAEVAEILQLDNENVQKLGMSNLKRALKDKEKIQNIHEIIRVIWPSENDLNRILSNEKENHSALFTGSYVPELLLKGFCRHSLYADKILLMDPFIYPGSVRPEYDPSINSEKFANTTLNNLLIWIALLPWIEAGIVNFIRSPGDFDFNLQNETLKNSYDLLNSLNSDPAFKKVYDQEYQEDRSNLRIRIEETILWSHSNAKIKAILKDNNPQLDGKTIENFVKFANHTREHSPYIVDSLDHLNSSQVMFSTTGFSHFMAKEIALRSGAHLITDLKVRWKFIEEDQRKNKVDNSGWEPFAKSIQEARLSTLNLNSPALALRLRKENRLESMRGFLRKVWNNSAKRDEFSLATTENFTTELQHELRIAEEEWGKMDRDIVKYATSEGIIATVADVIIHANWQIGLATSVALGATLLHSKMSRNAILNRYPGSLFIGT